MHFFPSRRDALACVITALGAVDPGPPADKVRRERQHKH
jgi:hypothetical protein